MPIYEDDIIFQRKLFNATMIRFRIIVGELSSGNTKASTKLELMDILDFLYNIKKITRPRMNEIVSKFVR